MLGLSGPFRAEKDIKCAFHKATTESGGAEDETEGKVGFGGRTGHTCRGGELCLYLCKNLKQVVQEPARGGSTVCPTAKSRQRQQLGRSTPPGLRRVAPKNPAAVVPDMFLLYREQKRDLRNSRTHRELKKLA